MNMTTSKIESDVDRLAGHWQQRRYEVKLDVQFRHPVTGQPGTGVTIEISRRDVVMWTTADGLRRGDSLCFLVSLPAVGARPGAVAFCRGCVTSVGNAALNGLRLLALTIDRHSLRRGRATALGPFRPRRHVRLESGVATLRPRVRPA
jgi:hypothetical protein